MASHVRRVTVTSPIPNLNYSETDSRHTRAGNASHGSWASVESGSGPMDEGTWEKSGSFPDGPARWRQT